MKISFLVGVIQVYAMAAQDIQIGNRKGLNGFSEIWEYESDEVSEKSELGTYLRLMKIKCIHRTDFWDEDEITVMKEGEKFWPVEEDEMTMDQGDEKMIEITSDLNADVTFTLVEHDKYTSDDMMNFTFTPSDEEGYHTKQVDLAKNARYDIVYQIYSITAAPTIAPSISLTEPPTVSTNNTNFTSVNVSQVFID